MTSSGMLMIARDEERLREKEKRRRNLGNNGLAPSIGRTNEAQIARTITCGREAAQPLFDKPSSMPGTLPILAALAVVFLAAWLGAWYYTRNPIYHDPREDFRKLQRQAAWLEQRLDIARREHWDADMIARLSDELGVACRELAVARGGVIDRKTRHVH
jgi:hypothetical protein